MPIVTGLEIRIQKPPFDVAKYESRLPGSETVARAIPLIHVGGRFESLLATPPHEIPTSQSKNSQNAEDYLGYPRSVYFFAGRACPRFGNVALAFSPDCETGRAGSVTPFDSGALVHPKKHIRIQLDPDDELPARIQYGKASCLELSEWRPFFAQVLAAYFDTDIDYWIGRPGRIDPEFIYELNTSWESWTFEVRFYEPQAIHDRIAWSADEGVLNRLRQMLNDQPVTIPGDPPTALDRIFEIAPLDPSGSPTFCATMDRWAREQCGL